MKSKKYGKILAALLCAGLLAGWHAPPVFAVDITVTVTEENQTEIQGTFELADTDIDTAVTDEKNQSVAIGTKADAKGVGSTAIGYGAKANHYNNYATIVGNGAGASANFSTALGYKAYAVGANSVAIGYGSQTSQGGTVSFGALGVKNKITSAPDYRNLEGIKDVYVSGGINFTKGGVGNNEALKQGEMLGVTSINGITLVQDTQAQTSSYGQIVFDSTSGEVKTINGLTLSELGNGNTGSSGGVDGKDIEPDSVTTDKVTVGTMEKGGTQTVIDNTGATFTSDEGTTTINGGGVTTTTVTTGQTTVNNAGVSIADKTVITDSDVVINKGTAGQVSLADVGQRMTVAENRIDRLGEEIDEVGALSAALAGLHPNPINANSRADFAMAVGSYDGESAIAAGAFYRPDKRTMLSLGASATSGNQMFNMGVTFALDRLPEKPAADSEVLAAVMARLEKLEAENAQLRAQYAELKEQTAQ